MGKARIVPPPKGRFEHDERVPRRVWASSSLWFSPCCFVYWYVRDITQKRHSVPRNYPIVGHLRFFFEHLGEYFRQYFFLGDREEMPFNRATRAWVYRMAKDEGGMSVRSLTTSTSPGALLFVNAPFAVLKPNAPADSAAGHRRRLRNGPNPSSAVPSST